MDSLKLQTLNVTDQAKDLLMCNVYLTRDTIDTCCGQAEPVVLRKRIRRLLEVVNLMVRTIPQLKDEVYLNAEFPYLRSMRDTTGVRLKLLTMTNFSTKKNVHTLVVCLADESLGELADSSDPHATQIEVTQLR